MLVAGRFRVGCCSAKRQLNCCVLVDIYRCLCLLLLFDGVDKKSTSMKSWEVGGGGATGFY